jgi:hypothetical protein
MANLDGKRLAALHVDDGERSELLPITQLVVDKVQAPYFILALGLAARLSRDHHLAPPWQQPVS